MQTPSRRNPVLATWTGKNGGFGPAPINYPVPIKEADFVVAEAKTGRHKRRTSEDMIRAVLVCVHESPRTQRSRGTALQGGIERVRDPVRVLAIIPDRGRSRLATMTILSPPASRTGCSLSTLPAPLHHIPIYPGAARLPAAWPGAEGRVAIGRASNRKRAGPKQARTSKSHIYAPSTHVPAAWWRTAVWVIPFALMHQRGGGGDRWS